MQSYNGMLANCQQLFTEYLKETDTGKSSKTLLSDIKQMISDIQVEIRNQSEMGANTVLLEKIQDDLLRIREDWPFKIHSLARR